MRRRWGRTIGARLFMARQPDLFFLNTYSQGDQLSVPSAKLAAISGSPVAYATYDLEKTRAVTTYLVKPDIKALQTALNTGKVELVQRTLSLDESVDSMLHIRARHKGLGELAQPYMKSLRHDIFTFYQKKSGVAAEQNPHQLSFLESTPKSKSLILRPPADDCGFFSVESLEFHPMSKRIKPDRFASVKNGKGRFHNGCPLAIGFDPYPNCPSNTTPDGLYNPKGRCDYCYAWQNAQNFMSTVFDIDRPYVYDKIIEISSRQGIPKGSLVHFRIGQTVEANLPTQLKKLVGGPDNLKIFLEAMIRFQQDHEVRGAMPTKWPFFDDETIALLKRNRVTVLASIGYEALESGMVMHGSTVDARLEGSTRLAEKGITSAVYIMTNISQGMDAWQPDARKAYRHFLENDKLSCQFLDLRPPKRLAEQTLGSQWYGWEEKGSASLFGNDFVVANNGRLHSTRVHDDYLRLIGDNTGRIRLCSVHTPTKYCGKCFMDT